MAEITPATRDAERLDVLVPCAVFLAGFAYLYAFLRLGWFMEDEGVLYYQYLRVFHGQVPYRDFFTGYPPLVYYLHAWAFRLCGVSIQVLRVVMAIVNALTAAGLYAVTRRVAGRGAALIPPVLFLTMQPGDIAVMVFHNSPYPSWYAVTFAVLGTWALLRALEARSANAHAAWLVCTGVCGGLTLLSKQTAGIFFLWGATGFLASHPGSEGTSDAAEPLFGRALRIGYLALIPLAMVFLIKNFIVPATLTLFVAPLATLVIIGARRRFDAAACHMLMLRLICVAAGVALAVGPWLIYFAARMGIISFLGAIFFPGVDVDRNLYVPFPSPAPVMLLLLIPLAVWTVLAWDWLGHQHATGSTAPAVAMRRRWVVGSAALCIAAALVSQSRGVEHLLHFDYNLWQIYSATSDSIDNLAAYLCLLALAVGLAVAWRHGRGALWDDDPPPEAFLCVLWGAECMMLLYYPRMDYAHLFEAVPLLYVVGIGLLGRFRSSVVHAFGNTRTVTVGFNLACVLLIGFIAATKSAPKVYSRVMLARTANGFRLAPTPAEWLRFDRAQLYVPIYLARQRLQVEAFRELITHLQQTTPPGEPVFAFPALPMVYFLSGRDNPTRHDYFLGDNVSFREQMEVVRTLEQQQVPTVILHNDPTNYFVAKDRDFTRLIWDYVARAYYLDRRIGPYDVMRRYATRSNGGRAAVDP